MKDVSMPESHRLSRRKMLGGAGAITAAAAVAPVPTHVLIAAAPASGPQIALTLPCGVIAIAVLPAALQPLQFVSPEYLRLLAKAPTPVAKVNFVQRPPGVSPQMLRSGGRAATGPHHVHNNHHRHQRHQHGGARRNEPPK